MVTFSIKLHKKDRALLESISSNWGVGRIYDRAQDQVELRVYSVKELQVIIAHFDLYPLITQKRADYLLFKQAYNIIKIKNM